MGKLSLKMINNLFSHTANKGQSRLLGPRLFQLYMIFALFIKNPNSKFEYIFEFSVVRMSPSVLYFLPLPLCDLWPCETILSHL